MADKSVGVDKGNDVYGKFRDESDGTYSPTSRARLEGWDSTGAAWIKVAVSSTGAIQTSGSTAAGGGGAATIADGADVAEGTTTDAAVVTDVSGTISGKLRGLVKWAFERMPAALGQTTMAASLPVTLASNQSALTVQQSTAANLKVDASGVAVPVTDNAGSLTVDAPVATPLFARLSDGAAALVGQKAMTASLPVVLASDQASVPVAASAGTNLNTSLLALETTQSSGNTLTGAVTETAPATDTASSGLNGRLQRVAQRITSLIALLPASLGQKTMANGLAVTIASDQTVVPVSDNAGSLTVDAPVGTPLFARLSDGAAALIAQKTAALSLPVVLASDAGLPPDLLIVTAVSSAAGAAITASLPSGGSGIGHYIDCIQIVAYNTAARTGGVTPVTVTTTNLPGSLAFTFGSAGAVGANEIQQLNFPNSVKSSVTNTATTVVCPATTSVIWRINVFYRTAP